MNRPFLPYALGFFVAIGFVNASPAFADQYQCLSIQNSDRRAFCIARATGDRYKCLSIQNPDFRSFCVAQLTGDRYVCLSIQNPDSRQECLSMF